MTFAGGARRSEPVSDLKLLAAIDRAERHSQTQGVLPSHIPEHLGFTRGRRTIRQLRPQIEALTAAQVLVRSRLHGSSVWGLTTKGRRRLAKARREGQDLALPESPQHQSWRHAHEQAEGIDEFRGELAKTLTEARTLLATNAGDPHAWSDLSRRLRQQCALLGWSLYCLHDWPEPDDTDADISAFRRIQELQISSTDLIGVIG
jgi:hypothetical protein